MTPEIWELFKPVISVIVGSGLTFAAIATFGRSWFFKKLDANYAVDFAQRNNQLMGQLEQKKNDLNKELQIEVTHFKFQLEVLGSQQSKFLEKKINSILLLSQNHYLAVKAIKKLTDVTNVWVGEASNFFKYQIDDPVREKLSSYDVYRGIHNDRWPSYYKSASVAFDKYAECLALNMPILAKELVEEEMQVIDQCRKVLADASMNFARAMNFSQYIVVPEECEDTEEECMAILIKEHKNSIKHKQILDGLSNSLFDKSIRSGALVESLLQHQANS